MIRLTRIILPSLVCIAIAGCDSQLPIEGELRQSAPSKIATRFDPASCGSVSGKVWWSGAVPSYAQIPATIILPNGKMLDKKFANPNCMTVTGSSQSIQNALVFLEGVEPEQSRPWDHEPARIEISEEQIRVIQGSAGFTNIGVVHTGDEVEIVSRQEAINILSARGTAFFGLALPDPNREVRHRFDQAGLVELSSGASRYWHRAYLWVTDHPYFAATDSNGCFTFSKVPAGEYRLITWHPSGEIAGFDRDPNTSMVFRYHFAEPFRTSENIRVVAGVKTTADCLLSK